MTAMTKAIHAQCYYVVHPLDDEPEEKCDTEALGRMHMSPSVNISLLALRAYLILMVLLVIYKVLTLAGLF